MPSDARSGGDRAPSAERSRELRDLLRWSDVDRCRFLIGLTIPFTAAYAARCAYLLAYPTVEPYYDRVALVWLRGGLGIASAFWVVYVIAGHWVRRRPGGHTAYLLAGTLSWWLVLAVVAYILGPITSPAWVAVLIGGMLNVLLLPRGLAIAGIASGMALVVASVGAMASGWLPYAPLLEASPMQGTRLALPYAIGNTLVSVIGTVLALVIMGALVSQWRRALGHLERVNRQLGELAESRGLELLRRKEAERALRASETRYRMLVENAGDLVAEIDAKGAYAYVSPNYRAVLGYEPDDLLGRRPVELIHPEDRAEIARGIETLIESETAVTRRLRFRDAEGHWRWFESYGKSFRSRAGQRHVVVVSRDIGALEKAEEERRQLEVQMRETQKLESLGILAGGIAHDFNNLLVPILGNAHLLESELSTDAPARCFVEQIEAAALRASELTHGLLAYAGKGKVDTRRVDLGALSREMGELLRSAIPRKVELSYDVADGVDAVEGDATQLRQMVMNLVTNAAEAIGDDRGCVRVRLAMVEATRAELDRTMLGAGLPEGRYVALTVSDDGCGMDPETCARMFEPFFTTKFTGRGLGLAALLGIVRGHGGTLEVESQVGRGTTFRVLLPAAGEGRAEARPSRPPPTAWRGEGSVLVVDDDPAVRDLLERLLTRHGLRVLLAKDGREGVERFRAHADEIDLVLLDVTMPELGGAEALQALRRVKPAVRVLLSSGYGEGDVAERLRGESVDAFLHKPYRPDELIRILRTLLGR